MATKFKRLPRSRGRTHGASRDDYDPNSALSLAIIFAVVSLLVVISMVVAYCFEKVGP